MNLATSTVLLILAVIPGFATLFGFYASSRLGGQLRDVTPKSQAGEIAMVLFLALTIHALAAAMLVAADLAGLRLPAPGLTDFFGAIEKDCVVWSSRCSPQPLMAGHSKAIFTIIGYVLGSSLLGFFIGRTFITAIESKFLGIKVKRFHSWTYDFIVGRNKPLVYVTVLTSIADNGVYLGYRGALDQMNLDADQNLKAVLLSNVFKVFFPLDSLPGKDVARSLFVPIDTWGEAVTALSHSHAAHANGGDIAKLMIPGNTILNLGLEVFAIEEDIEGQRNLQEALNQLG